jgi:hypothetical protein
MAMKMLSPSRRAALWTSMVAAAWVLYLLLQHWISADGRDVESTEHSPLKVTVVEQVIVVSIALLPVLVLYVLFWLAFRFTSRSARRTSTQPSA